jgi:hypothetical protein
MAANVRGRSNDDSRMWQGGIIAVENFSCSLIGSSWNDNLARVTIRALQHKFVRQTAERSYCLSDRDRESRKILAFKIPVDVDVKAQFVAWQDNSQVPSGQRMRGDTEQICG